MHTQDDAAEAEWFSVAELPPLAFDHKLVGAMSVDYGAAAELMQWRSISPKNCCHPSAENAMVCCRWCAQPLKNSQSMLTSLPQVDWQKLSCSSLHESTRLVITIEIGSCAVQVTLGRMVL